MAETGGWIKVADINLQTAAAHKASSSFRLRSISAKSNSALQHSFVLIGCPFLKLMVSHSAIREDALINKGIERALHTRTVGKS